MTIKLLKPTTTRLSIFITGAGSGIGWATAHWFARRGWLVGAGDIHPDALAALRTSLGEDQVLTYVLDVTQTDPWRDALGDFHRHAGRLDVLVNNAGILVSGPWMRTALEQHQALINVNVQGLLNGCYLAYPYLIHTPGSRVINMSSCSAIYGQAGLATYSASKFAVRGLTEALHLEWHSSGVRVMDVMPLFVQTPMVHKLDARSIDRLGVRFTADDVARIVWKAANCRGRLSKVHWSVGPMSALLFSLTHLAPQCLRHWMAKRISV